MLVMNKRQSAFVKQSADSYGKDSYCRFVKDIRYNWRKLLMLITIALIRKIKPLQKDDDHRLLIIDDTVEPKRGKQIEGSYKSIYSNKEHRTINGINIVSLNYTDIHSTFQIDFSLRLNDCRRREIANFTSVLHHKSNAHKRRCEAYTYAHIRDTATIINSTTINYLSTLQLGLEEDVRERFLKHFDHFKMLNDYQVLDEQKRFLELLSPTNKVIFRSNHASNALHLAGTLPKDTARLLEGINTAITIGEGALVPNRFRGF